MFRTLVVVVCMLITLPCYGGINLTGGSPIEVPETFKTTTEAWNWANSHSDLSLLLILQDKREKWLVKSRQAREEEEWDEASIAATQAQFFREAIDRIVMNRASGAVVSSGSEPIGGE